MPDFVSALLSGGAIALFSVGLTARWERRRRQREHRERQRLALKAFREEMVANRSACASNLTMLNVEERDFDQGAGPMVNSLSPLESGAWPMARVDLPTELLADDALVRELRVIAGKTLEVNAQIQTRESFRIQHLDADGQFLIDGLRRFKKILAYPLEDLIKRIDQATEEIEPFLQ